MSVPCPKSQMRPGKSKFFFAPLRLCAFALKFSSIAVRDTAKERRVQAGKSLKARLLAFRPEIRRRSVLRVKRGLVSSW
jgi:hypothetical protein